MLDNIKETNIDTSSKNTSDLTYDKTNGGTYIARPDKGFSSKDSKLIRPKSYPVKTLDTLIQSSNVEIVDEVLKKESVGKDKQANKESKLVRPKSYPTSSPSPEKLNIIPKSDDPKLDPGDMTLINQLNTNDVEVSFNVNLPKKSKALAKNEPDNKETKEESDSLLMKKYAVDDNIKKTYSDIKEQTPLDQSKISNGGPPVDSKHLIDENSKLKSPKQEDLKKKSVDSDSNEKKSTIKRRIIRKVSSKSKADIGSPDCSEAKVATEKKKIVKKTKDKANEETKPVTKKKSMLQSIGQKFEKFTSTKSGSPEKDKVCENKNYSNDLKKEAIIKSRTEREQSVPVHLVSTNESNHMKRSNTITDVAALDNNPTPNAKTTVSKVLGLFKKSESKDKSSKSLLKSQSLDADSENKTNAIEEKEASEKAKRPNSLLLNGLGHKRCGRTLSDNVSVMSAPNNESDQTTKKESDSNRNSLKLDFSRLPRCKKVVPSNPAIEPQIFYSGEKKADKNDVIDRNGTTESIDSNGIIRSNSRSRSGSRSNFSKVEIKPEHVISLKVSDVTNGNQEGSETHQPYREHEPTTPDKEDVIERIRRKSFYSRFNEKKQRRKSNIVGPGAVEYDPVARLYGPGREPRRDESPASPLAQDLSPGFSASSDLSPCTERYRSLMTDLPISPRNNSRYDNYGMNDHKLDSYRSLDRRDFKKYPSSRSYLDYDNSLSYGSNRYSRTMSLHDGSDGADELSLGHLRDPHKYSRTVSMYSPGSYATYRPKRTRNSAIILKESEKEPSPENILDKIRQRKKLTTNASRKPDFEDTQIRSNFSSKGESDGAECSEKVN